ncbi:ribonuclease H [uncultured Bifidobacterium sp.]|uniref:ribonuclease H family protein n=1 Tax=uncultured Bifidobacterium sp. TaxID=165187 RepID=UPI0028DCB71F|nr:ribonuclease H [uncultured Bifidobacterium sp.]
MTMTVSTDGSALANPHGPMGWAWTDHETPSGRGHAHPGDHDAGGATNGTNQIGELCAVLEALRAHPGDEPLVIETDSQYAINCSTTWVRGWKRKGWRNSQGRPVKNAPLIKAIDAAIARRPGSVRFRWVKGHAGNAGNEKVDDLARTYAGDCRDGVRDGYLPREGWQSLMASDYAKGLDVPSDARLLLDGSITDEDYHLGRGENADADDKLVVTTPNHTDPSSSPADMTDSPGIAGADSPLASWETGPEPRDVPDDDRNAGRHPHVASDASADVDAVMPARGGAGAADAEAARTDAMVQDPDSAGSHPVTADRHPGGLTVSGTLRFSPPPSSSPSFDGRPRRIRGVLRIEGLVGTDGRLALDETPFDIA